MHNVNQSKRPNSKPAPLQIVVAATLLLVLAFSAGCKKPPVPAAARSAAARPSVVNQPSERTPEEIALIDDAIRGDTAGVKSLLDHGVNANTKDPDGRTPLTEAAYYGHTEIVKLLLDHGADVFAKKVHGETAYDMAAGHQDIAQMIKGEMDLLDVAGKGDVK